MPFLPPNQQRQSTEGSEGSCKVLKNDFFLKLQACIEVLKLATGPEKYRVLVSLVLKN